MIAKYLTVGEVSAYLKLPEETVYKYARSGRMPASKVGRYWRFERSLVDDWVASRSNQVRDAKRVCVVDDDPAIRGLFSKWLRDAGCEVSTFGNGEELLGSLNGNDWDVLLLDLVMPSANGLEVLRRLRSLRSDLAVVIVTAHFDSHLMDEALIYGPLSVLRKPVERNTLLTAAIGERTTQAAG